MKLRRPPPRAWILSAILIVLGSCASSQEAEAGHERTEAGEARARRDLVDELLGLVPHDFESILIVHANDGLETHPTAQFLNWSSNEPDLRAAHAQAEPFALIMTGRDFAPLGIGGGDHVGARAFRFRHSTDGLFAALRNSRSWKVESDRSRPSLFKPSQGDGGGLSHHYEPSERLIQVDDKTLLFLTNPERMEADETQGRSSLAKLRSWASFTGSPLDVSRNFLLFRARERVGVSANGIPEGPGFPFDGFYLEMSDPKTLAFRLAVKTGSPGWARAELAEYSFGESSYSQHVLDEVNDGEPITELAEESFENGYLRMEGAFSETKAAQAWQGLMLLRLFGFRISI